MKKFTPAEQSIIDALSNFPEGLTSRELKDLLEMPIGTISSRVCGLSKAGTIESVGNGKYRLPKATAARPRESVPARTTSKDVPAYMRNQTPRKVTLYSINRLSNVMQMKLCNGLKCMTVPLIGQSIRIHIGNDVQEWPFSEAFTGYTEIEFTFSNGEAATITVSRDDVITVALETESP